MPGRWLKLETPLGDDALIPTAVVGHEGMSKLFRFEISVLAKTDTEVTPANLLTKSVTLTVMANGATPRVFNGIVIGLSSGGTVRNEHRSYQLIVAPEIWQLDLSSDYKVFQKKSVPDIVKDVLSDQNVAAYSSSLSRTYTPREYCVQYGETHLAFILRLFAEEGIFFFFKHESGKHTLTIGDSVNAYQDAAEGSVEFHDGDAAADSSVYAFEMTSNLVSLEWELDEFNFKTPNQYVSGKKVSGKDISGKTYKRRVYGLAPLNNNSTNSGVDAGVLGDRAKFWTAATDGEYEVGEGASTCASFSPGYKFSLSGFVADAKKYLVKDTRHESTDNTYIASGSTDTPFYRNNFSCIPATEMALAPPPTQKPFVRGPQTATVVGAQGDEIHTDDDGRIRVQFHWDAVGKKDDSSSCYVRVAQSWAGATWGSMFVPRVGMEVVVQFLDGDPDRPLVTGAVYNATNMPLWAQGTKEMSGWRTRSTPKGTSENANWLLFNDKKDSEKVDIQAEKDFLRTVKNDDTLEVRHDQTRTVKNNRTTTISEGNDTLTIEKGNREETIKTGNETLTVETGNRTETIKKGNDALAISTGARTVTLDQGDHKLTLSGGNQVVAIAKGNQTTTLNVGNQSTTLTKGNQTTSLNAGNLSTSLNAGNIEMTCSVGKITLSATGGITLKCGPSKIELSPSGITISSVQVSVKGTAKAEIAGALVNVSGDGLTNIKGGIVKIN